MHEHLGRSYEQAREYLGKLVKVKIDRPIGSKHPKHELYYKVNYGYVVDTIAPDGEGIDVYFLGVKEPMEEGQGICVAVVHRKDDDDDSLIVLDKNVFLSDEEIRKAVEFQEQYFDFEILRK